MKSGNPNWNGEIGKNTRWKKGQSGNPAGRPPGRRSLSQTIQEMLEDGVVWENLPIKAGRYRELFGDRLKWDAIVAVAITQSMTGDAKARDWLRKAGYGDKVDITTNGKDLPIPILQIKSED